ncbi:MAG: phosphate-selective porin OprO/OprP [Maribacter sp.]|jgi:phosphate-selective porin OprO/OprP
MKIKTLFIVVLCSFSFLLMGQNKSPQVNLKFGKGLQVIAADSSSAIKMNIRFQSLLNTQRSLDTGADWETSFLIRRARLKFTGWALNQDLSFKVELGLSNKDISTKYDFGEVSGSPKLVLDAVMKYKVFKNLEIWAGQTKLPGNRERVISSQKLQFVDRSLVNSIFNLDREMTVQLHSKFKFGKSVIKPIAAWSFGDGRNTTIKNIGGFSYTGRLEWLPMGEFKSKGDYFSSDLKREGKAKLSLGITYNFNQGSPKQKQSGRFLINDDGDYLDNDLHTVFIDMMFKYKGFSMLGEFAHKSVAGAEYKRNNDLRQLLVDVDGRSYYTGNGISLQAGYLLKKNYELAFRYTQVMSDTEVSFGDTKEYTLGLSKYIIGHSLKLQTDVSLLDGGADWGDKTFRYRIQMEVGF